MTYPLRNGEHILTRQADNIREQLNSALRIVDELTNAPLVPARITERDVQAVLSLRRYRQRFFDGDLFADPAWDILLELFAAQLG